MTQEEIETVIKTVENKMTNIKELLADCSKCAGNQSKAILLAAAGKLASEFKPTAR